MLSSYTYAIKFLYDIYEVKHKRKIAQNKTLTVLPPYFHSASLQTKLNEANKGVFKQGAQHF